MRVLMLSHSDAGGGAAIAARRLQYGLRARGVDVRMLVRRKKTTDEDEAEVVSANGAFVDRARFVLDKLPVFAYPRRDGSPFSSQWLPDRLAHHIRSLQPDVVNVHWIGHGYMRPSSLGSIAVPVVWTLHDVWPFTGGCHVNLECTRYAASCGACPRLGSTRSQDLSYHVWQRKQRAWSARAFNLVSPSKWLAGCAKRSSLFRDNPVDVIPNGLDTERFHPDDRLAARSRRGLPADKRLVLFVAASGTRVLHKGFDLLESALAYLGQEAALRDELEIILVGPKRSVASVRSPFRARFLGRIGNDHEMASIYAAADVTVLPSRQENLPQVGIESLACGTPVVAFDTTGVPEVVDHQQNGYLATAFDGASLARGLSWVLESEDRRRKLREAARAKARSAFDINVQTERYHELFGRLSADHKKDSVR